MTIRTLALPVALAALVSAPCLAVPSVTITETFDGETIDQASWRAGSHDVILFGGNPGDYLRVLEADAAEPRFQTVASLAQDFLGNYRSKGVIGLGIDVNLFGVGISAEGRPVSLSLLSDMGTPDDPLDDCEAVLVGRKNLPNPGTGWKTYDFKVPSQSTTLPNGWIMWGTCANLAPDEAWNVVIQNVVRASFDFGEPGFFYFFQIWSVGYDNPRITFGN